MVAVRLLEHDPGSTFSDLWYRVGPLRPRISVHARVTRQSFAGRVAYVLEDPAGGPYHRLSAPAYFFIGLLDGRRTVGDAWDACNAQLGDDAPTQRECVEALARLQLAGLLVGDEPLSPEMVARRREQVRAQGLRQRTGMFISPSLPLWNPDRFLEGTSWLWRAAFSRAGAVAFAILLLVAILAVASRASSLLSPLNQILSPSNLAWLGVVFVALRAWHELGHAAACKAMGARCTEVGLILLLGVLPFPYCDASGAWKLPRIRQRVVVSAAGMIFESFAAAIAAIVWASAGPGLVKTICFNVMVVSGVTTLLFNLNPLLRYDGYYILSDVLGIANLWQRSREAIVYLIERVAFSVPGVRPPPVASPGEFWTLVAYAALSLPYRLVVAGSIVWLLWSSETFLTLGVVLAFVAACAFLVWPVLRGVHYLLASPRLLGRRARAMAACTLLIGGVAALLGLVPMPTAVYAPGVVRAEAEEPVRCAEGGFVVGAHARVGDAVRAGDPIVTLRNPDLEAELAVAKAALLQAEASLDEASTRGPTAREVALRGLDAARADLGRAQARVGALVLTATIAGTITPAPDSTDLDLDALEGRYVERGTLLAIVATTDRLIVRGVVSDSDQAYAFPTGVDLTAARARVRPAVRIRGEAGRVTGAEIIRFPPSGTRRLESAALAATAGGDVSIDPTGADSLTALSAQFAFDAAPRPGAHESWRLGRRARIRLGLPSEPLMAQWWRRAVQVFSRPAGA